MTASARPSHQDLLSSRGCGFYPVEQDCAWCGKSSYSLRACTRCWAAKYCGRQCQGRHWKQHKGECVKDPSRSQYFRGGRVLEVDIIEEAAPEVSTSEEDAIFLSLDTCPKNSYNNHAHFLSVTELGLDNLPKDIRRADVLEYILAQSQMTVRVLVKWTSKHRPAGDACANFRGTKQTRTASGTYVLDNPSDFRPVDCQIPKCHRTRDLGPNHQMFEGDLKIFTNKHVLYDNEELDNTVVDFFYNSGDKRGMVREYATKLFYTKPTSDKTFFKVSIHDEELFWKLDDLDLERADCFRKLSPEIHEKMSSFAIIISHPHGMPKKISIGRVVNVTEENVSEETMENSKLAGELARKWFTSRKEEDYGNYMACLGKQNLPVLKIWYDTPTCQGSSGGHVLFGARQCGGIWGPYMATHTAFDLDSTLNFFKVVRTEY